MDLPLLETLESRIQARTSRRVRDLDIDLAPDRIVLRGFTTTYHVKQLAQQGVRDILPEISLDNDIVVR